MTMPSLFLVGTDEWCEVRYGPWGPSIDAGTREDMEAAYPDALLPMVPPTPESPVAPKKPRKPRKAREMPEPEPDAA
jgi:hypothetical protein